MGEKDPASNPPGAPGGPFVAGLATAGRGTDKVRKDHLREWKAPPPTTLPSEGGPVGERSLLICSGKEDAHQPLAFSSLWSMKVLFFLKLWGQRAFPSQSGNTVSHDSLVAMGKCAPRSKRLSWKSTIEAPPFVKLKLLCCSSL